MVGGKAVMGEQLSHLLALGRCENLTVRVLPFVDGAYAGADVSFDLFGLSDSLDAHAEVACLESPSGCLCADDPRDLSRYSAAFDLLRAQALTPAASAVMIENLIETP
jgi:hypothetical protein